MSDGKTILSEETLKDALALSRTPDRNIQLLEVVNRLKTRNDLVSAAQFK